LIDETSASASEVLSGALQDWDRATIIGRRTFGKGLVQQQFQLGNGGALRLTVSRYYSPLGRNIQKPYFNKSRKEYNEEIIERYHDGEVVKGDSLKSKGPAFKTPAGRTVYGGGGITPDIFVAADTSFLNKQMAGIYKKNSMSKFVYTYFLENKTYFKAFSSVESLILQFVPSEKEWLRFNDFIKKDSLSLNKVAVEQKNYILKQIQELMVKQLFKTEGYFEAMNKKDNIVQRGLLAFKN
jgi:carboxyl-terminal processing protease